jgi:hypothetical protein
MSVNPGSLITAANYNSLQSRVANLLGAGFGGTGYGQDLVSAPVAVGESVTAEHMNLLREDINRAHVHQTGSLSSLVEINPQELIGANAVNGDTEKGFNAYIAVVTILEGNAGEVDGTQVTLETATTSTRFAAWAGELVHQFTVNFDDANHRRAFFNAGGEIHMSAEIVGDNSPKGQDWNSILTNMGTIKFGKDTTTKTGAAGLVQPVGNFDLTASFQEIFQRRGQADYYAENRYFIYAKETATNAIQFRIEFLDNDQGDPNDDEAIRGTLTSIVKQLRPTGSYVSVDSPSYSTQSSLDEGD